MQSGFPGCVPANIAVFETMRAGADGRIALWTLHLDRLRAGCAALGFHLDESQALGALDSLPRGRMLRVRLAIDGGGGIAMTHQPLLPNPDAWRVCLSAERLDSRDPWLRIKTSYRPIYDRVRSSLPRNIDEAILLNERGEMCEGTITSLFLRRGNRLLTPPLECGLLPGVLRRSLLESGQAEEALLRPDDLTTGQIVMGNALRGLIPAMLVSDG